MDASTADELLTYAVEASGRIPGLDGKTALADLERRYPDLLAAMQWFIDKQYADEALTFVRALALFWTATKRLDDGVMWAERALAMSGGATALRSQALFEAGQMSFWKGDDTRAGALHHQALDLARQIDDPTLIALGLGGLARVALRTDVEAARQLCREALAVTTGTENNVGRSGALHVLGAAAQMAGELAEARELMMARIALARAMNNYAAISTEESNLSMVERQLGHLDAAEELAREALGIAYRRGDDWLLPYIFSGLAAIAAQRHEYERAAILIGAAEALLEAQGAAWPPDERLQYERTVTILTGALGATEYDRQRAKGQVMAPHEVVAFAERDHRNE